MVRQAPALRGDIWIVELDPTVGHEIQKTRPCLVVSPDAMNRNLPTVTIMPLTSGSRAAPFRLPIDFREKPGFLLADQLRTVDRRGMKAKVGEVAQDTLAAALAILREMFEEEERE